MIKSLLFLLQRRGTQLMAALFILTMFSIQLAKIAENVEYALFQSRWSEKRAVLNMLADDVDSYVARDADWDNHDYFADIYATITKMDDWIGVYAAIMDESLRTLSERVLMPGEHETDPASDPSFREAVNTLDRGDMFIPTKSINGDPLLMRLYFRWIPAIEIYNHPDTYGTRERLLLTIAMDSDAVDQSSLGELVGWCVALIAVAGLVMVWAIFVTAARRGEGKGRGTD